MNPVQSVFHPGSRDAAAITELMWILVVGLGAVFLVTMALAALALRSPPAWLGRQQSVVAAGIVTEFEFRLNPVGPTVFAGPVVWAMEDSPKVVRFYREWIQHVPEELTTILLALLPNLAARGLHTVAELVWLQETVHP